MWYAWTAAALIFQVDVGLHQECPLPPVLFADYTDRTSRHGQVESGVRFHELKIPYLLYADDVVLMASSCTALT